MLTGEPEWDEFPRIALRARENLSPGLTTQYNKIAPCKVIQDGLGFWIIRHGSWISDSLSVEFQLLSAFRVPKPRIPEFHEQKFHRFGNPYVPLLLLREIKIPKSKISNPKKSFDHPCHLKSGVTPHHPPAPLILCGGNDHWFKNGLHLLKHYMPGLNSIPLYNRSIYVPIIVCMM